MNAAILLTLLRDSLDEICAHYYGRDYFSDEIIERLAIDPDDPRLPALHQHLRRFGERVFCYELYHRLRTHLEGIDIPDGGPVLQGELKKREIHAILDFMPDEVEPLDKVYVPDFLYHSPVNFDHQELVIEVKSDPELTFPDIFEDLQKLSQFVTRYQYEIGIMLVINNEPTRIGSLLEQHLDELRELRQPQRIRILASEGFGSQLWEISLAEILH